MTTQSFKKYWSITWVIAYTLAFLIGLFATIKANAFGGFSEPIHVELSLPDPPWTQIEDAQKEAQSTGEIQIVEDSQGNTHVVGPDGEIS
jgi:hypothetical protein